MFVAYILTKSRFLKAKVVTTRSQGVFNYKGFEYIIDRDKMYQRKVWGIKTIFYSQYFEGNPNPIYYRDEDYEVKSSDVPLDEISLILKKMKMLKLELALLLVGIINVLISMGIIYMINELK